MRSRPLPSAVRGLGPRFTAAKRATISASLCLLLGAGIAVAGQRGPGGVALDPSVLSEEEFQKLTRDTLRLIGLSEEAIDELERRAYEDGLDDGSHPSGQQPGIRPPGNDIRRILFFEIQPTPGPNGPEYGEWLGDQRGEGAGAGTIRCQLPIVCPPDMDSIPILPGGYYGYGMIMSGDILAEPGISKELGVLLDIQPDEGEADVYMRPPQVPQDPFHLGNRAHVIRSEEGSPFVRIRLDFVDQQSPFADTPTRAFGYVSGPTYFGFIPNEEIDSRISARAFAFWAEGGNFSAQTATMDVAPDLDEMIPIDEDIPHIVFGAPEASPSPSLAESPSAVAPASPSTGASLPASAEPTEVAAATPNAAPTPAPGQTTPPDGGGGGGQALLFAVLLVGGGAIAAVGFYLWQRGRRPA